MKTLILFVAFILMTTASFAQNILDALRLQSDSIGQYREGELRSTDTIIDLRNGYYEEFLASEPDRKTILRQAAIFHNHDGSRTLAISITEYDFACMIGKTDFYHIVQSGNRISAVSHDDILPDLQIKDFLVDGRIIAILEKHVPVYRASFSNPTATIDDVLAAIYHIVYVQPRAGTDLLATLKVCDLADGLGEISSEEWSIIEHEFMSINLSYDKSRKKFEKP